MLRGAFSGYFVSKSRRKSQASSSGTKKGDSPSAQTSSEKGGQSSEPALKRSNSLPAHLPSNPNQPAEVKTVRKSITRPKPDTKPIEGYNYEEIAGGKREGAELKLNAVTQINENYFLTNNWMIDRLMRDPDLKKLIISIHPKINYYSPAQKLKAISKMFLQHHQINAETAKMRNELYGVPNHPTSSRLMEKDEQKFLTAAMQRINKDFVEKPFHIHGEWGVSGYAESVRKKFKYGIIDQFRHNPQSAVNIPVNQGDKYRLHSHPPFSEPYTSSASETDHRLAAQTYLRINNKLNEYVTNGKDVLHIQPAHMELVKLNPDPKVEKKLGKFPEAFHVPDPQQPPFPFANHEAPVTFNYNWMPPPGWKRPTDYPQHVFFKENGERPEIRPHPAFPEYPEPANTFPSDPLWWERRIPSQPGSSRSGEAEAGRSG